MIRLVLVFLNANMTGFFVDGIHGTPYIAAPWILWDPSWVWKFAADPRRQLLAPMAFPMAFAMRCPETKWGKAGLVPPNQHLKMDDFIWLWINTYRYSLLGDEHPFATYFDVHQGYMVLTHSHIDLLTCVWLKKLYHDMKWPIAPGSVGRINLDAESPLCSNIEPMRWRIAT